MGCQVLGFPHFCSKFAGVASSLVDERLVNRRLPIKDEIAWRGGLRMRRLEPDYNRMLPTTSGVRAWSSSGHCDCGSFCCASRRGELRGEGVTVTRRLESDCNRMRARTSSMRAWSNSCQCVAGSFCCASVGIVSFTSNGASRGLPANSYGHQCVVVGVHVR